MSQILTVLSTWLHALATSIFIGHFVLLVLIYLPALKDTPDITVGAILGEFSKRSRAWMYISLFVFAITGTHLMLIDPSYLGVGKFGNSWSILMLVKHILIVGMIGAGFWFNAILHVGPMLSSKTGYFQAFDRFRLYASSMAVAGVAPDSAFTGEIIPTRPEKTMYTFGLLRFLSAGIPTQTAGENLHRA